MKANHTALETIATHTRRTLAFGAFEIELLRQPHHDLHGSGSG